MSQVLNEGSRSLHTAVHWRRQDFVTGGGEVRYGFYRGSRVRSPPVPVVLSVYQRGSLLDGLAMYSSRGVIRRSSMTMKAHTYYIIFGRPPIGEASPLPPGGATAAVNMVMLTKGRLRGGRGGG